MRNNLWRAVLIGMAVSMSMLAPAATASAQTQDAAGQAAPFKEVDVGAGAFSAGEPVAAWVDELAMPDAAAVQQTSLRLVDTQFHLGDTASVHVRRAVIVKDAASLGDIGQIALPFVPDYQRLQLHAVRILRDGQTLDQTKSLAVRFIQRETGLERGIYSGEVTASILVSDLRVGDTLDYFYTIHGQNPVFGGKFMDGAGLDGTVPALVRRVVLSHPVGRTIYWRLHRDGDAAMLTPVETEKDGIRRLTFEERSVAAITPEPDGPPDYVAYRWLQFSEFGGWAEVAAWADGLFQVSDTSEPEFASAVERLRALPTEEERVSAALEFVQTEIRYFSVSLGESSHRPSQPSLVLRRRYGDCKDKTLLLIGLLRALGVESRPALLKVGSGKWLNRALPSADAFDHVIVEARVGGRAYHLDPTRLGQHGRLGRMGQSHANTLTLAVAQGTAALDLIPAPEAEDMSRNDISEVATVPKLGAPSRLQIRQVWTGVTAEGVRVARTMMTQEQFLQATVGIMERRYPGAKLAGEAQIEDDRLQNIVTQTASFEIPNLAVEQGGNWYVRYMPINLRGALPTGAGATRKTPLAIPAHPYEAKYSFEVRFPDDVSAMRDPYSKTLTDKHFELLHASSFRGNTAKAEIVLKTSADHMEVADIPAFVRTMSTMAEGGMGVVFIGKADFKSSLAADASFADRVRARLQETAEKTSETIKSGKLTGSDLAGAYFNRALVYGDLGRLDEALSDANDAIKVAPNDGDSHVARGWVHLRRGEFAKSIADYSKAITLGGQVHDIYKSRGVAKFYAGRLEDAAEDFVKAGNDADQDGALFANLWLAWTLQRLNKPLPEALAKQAAAEAQGEWPRPALALLAGISTPEDILKTIDAKTGDERQMARAEGYFYIGQYYAARGDKGKAREYFEKTREQGVLMYLEHSAAVLELRDPAAVR